MVKEGQADSIRTAELVKGREEGRAGQTEMGRRGRKYITYSKDY